MRRSKNYQLKLGILILAGLLFFIVSVYLLGKQQNLFSSTVKVTARFSDVKGLQIGNNIRFSGINVGTVTDIEIVNDSVISVEMSINKDVVRFIKKDAKVEITNEGLMGSKLITINPGTAGKSTVGEGDELLSEKTITSDELLEEAKKIVQSTKVVANNLINITEKLKEGNGDFSKLLNEDKITTNLSRASSDMVDISSEMKEITHKINNGNGDISKLLNDDQISEEAGVILKKLDSIANSGQKTIDNLQKASIQINEGKGIANKLIYDTVLAIKLDTTIDKLNSGIDEAKQAASTVDNSWILNVFSKRDKKKKEK